MTAREAAAVRVLLVSDDAQAVQLMSDVLEQIGMHFESCSDTQAASRKLSAAKYEGLVLDLALGESALDLLKSLPDFTANKEVVSCAILEQAHQKAAAFQAGANFTLDRPLNGHTAFRTIRAGYPMMVRERRRYFRCPVQTPALVSGDFHPEFQATSVNLSEGGMAILSPVQLKIGQNLQMRLRIPGKAEFIELSGEVCWTDPTGRAGVQFQEISPSAAEALESWLLQRLEEMMPRKNQMPAKDILPLHG